MFLVHPVYFWPLNYLTWKLWINLEKKIKMKGVTFRANGKFKLPMAVDLVIFSEYLNICNFLSEGIHPDKHVKNNFTLFYRNIHLRLLAVFFSQRICLINNRSFAPKMFICTAVNQRDKNKKIFDQYVPFLFLRRNLFILSVQTHYL